MGFHPEDAALLAHEMANEFQVPMKNPTAPSPEHTWFEYRGHTCCKLCGIIKRADGKNNPCRGIVRIALRQEDSPAPDASPLADLEGDVRGFSEFTAEDIAKEIMRQAVSFTKLNGSRYFDVGKAAAIIQRALEASAPSRLVEALEKAMKDLNLIIGRCTRIEDGKQLVEGYIGCKALEVFDALASLKATHAMPGDGWLQGWEAALKHAETQLAMRGKAEWVQEAIEVVRYDRNPAPVQQGGE